MKLKTHKKCKECASCVNLCNDGYFYCKLKVSDSKNPELDITTCRIDPESKPEECPWDKASKMVESLDYDDQTWLRCMAKMFGGKETENWFEYDQTNKEWLTSLPAERFYDEFKKTERNMRADIDTRLAMIEWLEKPHK